MVCVLGPLCCPFSLTHTFCLRCIAIFLDLLNNWLASWILNGLSVNKLAIEEMQSLTKLFSHHTINVKAICQGEVWP